MNAIHNMSKVQLELKVRFLNKEFFKFLRKSQLKKGQNQVIILIKKICCMMLLKNQNIVIQVNDRNIVKFRNLIEM